MRDPRQRNIRSHATASQGPVDIDWASPTAEEVFKYGPFPQCASGGFGSGKTYVMCLKVLWLMDQFPGNRGVIARKEFETLKHTTMATFFKICPPAAYCNGGKRSDSEKILRLNNGSELLWMHLDDPETENVIRGLEINFFFIDQAEEVQEEIFDTMEARLGRWDQAQVPQRMIDQELAEGRRWAWVHPTTGRALPPTFAMLACNPDTEVHWIWRRFHEDSPDHWAKKYPNVLTGQSESYHDKGYRMFIMNSEENKFLPKQNLNAMLSKDESFVRRFVRGEWGIPEGQIHEVTKLSILPGSYELMEWVRANCGLNRSFDHGDAAPACCLWWGVDGAGNVYVYREYYQGNELVSKHRDSIARMSLVSGALFENPVFEHYRLQLADPSIFHVNQQKHGGWWSTADEYSDRKNYPKVTAIDWTEAENNELGTRNRINEYLKVDPERIHPIYGTRGSPRLFFLEKNDDYPCGCRHVLTELKSQRRVKIGTDLGRPIFCDDRDEKIPDHAYDPLRYAIASRPPVAAAAAVHENPKSFKAISDEYLRWRSRGGHRIVAREARRRFRAIYGAT